MMKRCNRSSYLLSVCATVVAVICFRFSSVLPLHIHPTLTCPELLLHENNPQNLDTEVSQALKIPQLNVNNPVDYISQMKQLSDKQTASRLGCREYQAGLQSCVFSGIICANTSAAHDFPFLDFYLVDDTKRDVQEVPSDKWCRMRYQTSDPKYYSASRHWPILNDTIVPQGSCLSAYYRTLDSLLGKRLKQSTGGNIPGMKWVPSLHVLNMDYAKNNHNFHLLMDIVWMLDIVLWQQSLKLGSHPANDQAQLFENWKYIIMQHGKDDFRAQTSRDVNSLLYALVLQLPLSKLYPNLTRSEVRRAPDVPRKAVPFFKAYPKMERRILFHKDIHKNSDTDLVCAPRLTAGSKLGELGHERVCRDIRNRGWDFFGIQRPEMVHAGRVYFEQPPLTVLIMQRHISRKIDNAEELQTAIEKKLGKYGVKVIAATTKDLEEAENWVRLFSKAGVMVGPHGGQSMGMVWMPRNAAVVEVFPLGYMDYSYQLLAESCKIWYYEIRGELGKWSKATYKAKCGDHESIMTSPCAGFKHENIRAPIDEVVKTVRMAFAKQGHDMGTIL